MASQSARNTGSRKAPWFTRTMTTAKLGQLKLWEKAKTQIWYEGVEEYQSNMNLRRQRIKNWHKPLRDFIKANPTSRVTLQQVPESQLRRCGMGEACLFSLIGESVGVAGDINIRTPYRICFSNVEWNVGPFFYHVACFRAAVDMPSLLPNQFQLQGQGWGLLIRMWRKHGGRVDIDKIGKYIVEYERHVAARRPQSVENLHRTWRSFKRHSQCRPTPFGYGCIVQIDPKHDMTPHLEDFITEEPCSLQDVMEHVLMEKLPDAVFRTQASLTACSVIYVPEIEVGEKSGNEKEGDGEEKRTADEEDSGREGGEGGLSADAGGGDPGPGCLELLQKDDEENKQEEDKNEGNEMEEGFEGFSEDAEGETDPEYAEAMEEDEL